jgi:signal transduction histidine kinase
MRRLRRYALPLFALFAGLLATLATALMMADAEEGRRRAHFDRLADGAIAAIESRMLAQMTLLRGAAGFFNASEQVTREDFRSYVARLNLNLYYPGVLGIGYAAYDPRGSGSSAILFIEPLNKLNAQAIGFDMLSEATRRAAMLSAARSGRALMSGRVRLVQEIEPVKQPGFLIYAPLYRGGVVAPERLHGWVYSPLRAYDLFNAVFAARDMREIAVEIYDGSVAEAHLLYRSGQVQDEPRHEDVRPVRVAGRTWLVRITSSPEFEADAALPAAWGVTIAGALISLLVAALLFLQGRTTQRTEEQVQLRTAQLREANLRLIEEGEARKQAEATVAQMQKVEAIGQLTGGIAHDFNNMLTIVIGNLDIARRRLGDPEAAGRAIANASEGAQKAADLTQRLLAFGRKAALRPRVIDPNLLVGGMADILRRTIGETIRLETVLASSVWPICADPAQLESAILNLAINARDALPDNGTLRIETGNVTLRDGDLRGTESVAQGPHVRLTVSDTGHGMTPEVLARALDPFFTTKEVGKGTGLGLSQVYGFVRQSGGQLQIDSAPGAGTSVAIYLPRHADAAASAERDDAPVAALPRAQEGDTVLVCEDEAQVRAISVETLEELGYRVVAASDGEEALELLDRTPDVRLIFTDVVMPGINGRVLADRALDRRPDLKILFTTGYTADAIVHDGRLDADVTLIPKPFTAAQLAQKVREVLDG